MARMATAKRILLAFVTAVLIVSFYCIGLFMLSPNKSVLGAGLIHVACVGDSITEGSGYPENLQALLGDDFKVGNFGVSGSRVLLTSGLPYMNQSEFWEAKAFQPSIVVVMLGTNDATENATESVETFQADYTELVSAYATLENNPAVWLVKPPPILENDLNLNNTSLEQGIIPCIEDVANELDLPMIDVHTALTGYPEYFIDGVHPGSDGAMAIAREINQAITFNDTSAPF
jgi:lysophospholipase L1-like esterase